MLIGFSPNLISEKTDRGKRISQNSNTRVEFTFNVGVVDTIYCALNQCVWYCDSGCGCGLKKIVLKKILLVEDDLVFMYVQLKLWLKLRLNKKQFNVFG